MIDETIVIGDRTFSVELVPDDTFREPWKEHDGCGIVSDWRQANYTGYVPTEPGERILWQDGRYFGQQSALVYDWAGTIAKAKRDGWGVSDGVHAAMIRELGREPTAKEITAHAVLQDFDRLRAYCSGEWCYVGVVVTDDASGEAASLWGVESDCDAYINDIARDLCDEIPEPEVCPTCGHAS